MTRDGNSYSSLHNRVYKARGKANEHLCVECGKQAKQWATIHGTDGKDPFNDYQPMCVSCHRKYDTSINPMSQETKDKVRNKLKGKPLSEKNRLGIIEAHKKIGFSVGKIHAALPKTLMCEECEVGPFRPGGLGTHRLYKHGTQGKK